MGVHTKGMLRWKYIFEETRKNRDGKRNVTSSLLDRAPFAPDLFFVTDEKGVGVAACCEPGQLEWYNQNIAQKHPSIKEVEDGKSRKDIWFWRWGEGDKGAFYQVGIAPIMHGPQKLVGIVVIGRKISNNAAKRISEEIGHPVAYFYVGDEGESKGNQVFASTFEKGADSAISTTLIGDKGSLINVTKPNTVNLGDETYLAQVRTFQDNASKNISGFVVLTSFSKDEALLEIINSGILILGLLILLMLLFSLLIVIRSFVKPFEEIDQGIQEVLAGNKDYAFNVTGNYPFQTEMAHSLNLMSAFLQGKRMPDEEEPPEGWGELLFGEVTSTAMMRAVKGNEDPKVTGVPMSSAGTSPSQSEDVSDYKKRLFDEYFKAKENLGEDVSELNYDVFVSKLERHAGRLKNKHKAKEIRFSIVVRENKVVLKPQPIF